MSNRLKWYRSRLSAMSYAELLHRATEVALKWSGRHFHGGWDRFDADRMLVAIPSLHERLGTLDTGLVEIATHEAEKVRAGRFHLLGASWPLPERVPPPPEFWHLEPVSGKGFSSDCYSFDIPFRHGVDVAEIRRPWELNRLQFLVPLAIDAVNRADAANRDLVFAYLQSWMEGNPPYRGINWISGIEQALRVISVATAFSITGVNHLKNEERARLSQFFSAHEFWIARYPSLHSSANNHYMAELAGLITSAHFAQKGHRTEQLARKSLGRLLEQVHRQILPDGVGAEQAPGYSAFATELALFGLRAARQSVNDIPNATRERLVSYADHLSWSIDESGRIPDIGDWDNSRVIAMTQGPEPYYVASIASAVSGFLGARDLAPAVCPAHVRNRLFQSSPPQAPSRVGIHSWREGGYTVIRRDSPIPFVLTFDHGPLGYLAIAGHGHADALAIWLSVRGEPMIVDAGTYLYHSDPLWRERFRSTRAHNTLNIAGRSSSRPAGPFNWSAKANARLLESRGSPLPFAAAEHDGFLTEFGVRHRRSIEVLNECEILLRDELVGAEVNEPVAISFLLDPACQASVHSDATAVEISRSGQNVMRLACNGALRPRIVRGSEPEGLGWVSPSFGVKVPTDQIVFEGLLRAPSKITIQLL